MGSLSARRRPDAHAFGRGTHTSARRFFEKAVSLRPDYSSGFERALCAASCLRNTMPQLHLGRMPVEEPADSASRWLARRWSSIRRRRARAPVSGWVFSSERRQSGSNEETDTALINSPNCADACGARGAALVFSGRSLPKVIRAMERFLRLSYQHVPGTPDTVVPACRFVLFREGLRECSPCRTADDSGYPAVPMAYRWLAASLGQLDCVSRRGAHIVEVIRKAAPRIDRRLRDAPAALFSTRRSRAPAGGIGQGRLRM